MCDVHVGVTRPVHGLILTAAVAGTLAGAPAEASMAAMLRRVSP